MEIVWLIGYVFSVGYCDILSIKGFWASIGVIILFAILWPLFLGVEMRDIMKSSNPEGLRSPRLGGDKQHPVVGRPSDLIETKKARQE